MLTQKMKTIVALTSTHVIYIFGLNHSLKDMFSVVRSIPKHNNTTFFSISSNTLQKNSLFFGRIVVTFCSFAFPQNIILIHVSTPKLYFSQEIYLIFDLGTSLSLQKKTTLMPPAFRAYDLDFQGVRLLSFQGVCLLRLFHHVNSNCQNIHTEARTEGAILCGKLQVLFYKLKSTASMAFILIPTDDPHDDRHGNFL